MRLALILGALAALPGALAGSPVEPEIADAQNDCALPYAGGYLDIVSVWIHDESEDEFSVSVALATFDEALAEGAAYTVQFEHQGKRWGVLGMFRPVSGEGWEFYTGQVDAEAAASETFVPAAGAFDAGSATLTVPFRKNIFTHDDPDDRDLRGFYAATADLRTAYPFLLAVDSLAAGSSNGKWLVCDEAESDATYSFSSGAHSHEHGAASAPAEDPAREAEAVATPAAAGPSADGVEAPATTPAGAWIVAVALGLACLAWRRR